MIFTNFAITKDRLILFLWLVSLSISNASPIQFWLTGTETFNQKEECSIYPVCFCQTIDPSDTLRLDIRDTSDGTNYLVVYLDDGTIWNNFTFSSTGFDHHQYLLIIGSNGDWDTVLNRKLIFKITSLLDTILAPSSWSNGAHAFTTKSATTFGQLATGLTFTAYQPFVISAGQTPPSITLNIVLDFGSGNPETFELGWYNSIGGTRLSFSSYTGFGTHTFTFSPVSSQANFLQLSFISDSSGTDHITITIPVGQMFVPSSAINAISDCVEITDNQDFICTKLISYSNSTDFAGLGFPSWSPPSTYYLRIPAVFFEEQYPQEQEDLELSTDEIITLWSKIEAKKLLDIGFMPFYMHLKMQLILMMDTVSIDGVEYRLRDPYQITTGSKRHALKRAQVLLSEKDFINRNLL